MRGTFKVDDREIELAANAASPFLYSKIFQSDFEQDAESVTAWRKMTFVLAKQAELGEKELFKGKVSEADFVEWLAQFTPLGFGELIGEAANLYAKQQEPKTRPKDAAE